MQRYLQTTLLFLSMSAASLTQAAYVGLSGGYMADLGEMLISLHVGSEVLETDSLIHNLELEYGQVSTSDSITFLYEDVQYDVSADLDFNPFMINYIMRHKSEGPSSWYFGLGGGPTFWDLSVLVDTGDSEPELVEVSGTELALQFMVGWVYSFNEHFDARVGYRYYYLMDFEIEDASVGDASDSIIEVAFDYKF